MADVYSAKKNKSDSDDTKQGVLYLVATPIGNLGDMTSRAIETLMSVDIIAAEDTRNSIKLLNHFDIHTPMTSYHEHNRVQKAYELVESMLDGKNVALISDAGMPAISDPGQELVAMAHERGIAITVVPGASACISALAISGMPSRRFCFEGFLPTDKKQLEEVLGDLTREKRTIIIYEAPHRLAKTLRLLGRRLGLDRRICIVKELTKLHENTMHTTLGEASEHFESFEARGEYVLVIEGLDVQKQKQMRIQSWMSMPVESHMQIYLDEGHEKKEAMRMVAKDRGVSRRDIYNELEKNHIEP